VPLEDLPGVSFRKNGENVHNPEGAYIENLDELPVGFESLQARSRFQEIQRAVPAEPLHFVLHDAGLPGDVHVLPVAADALGSSVEAAVGGGHRE